MVWPTLGSRTAKRTEHNGGLWRSPQRGSRGHSPGEGSGGLCPLKLNAFYILRVQQKEFLGPALAGPKYMIIVKPNLGLNSDFTVSPCVSKGSRKFAPLLIFGKVNKSHSERKNHCLTTPTRHHVQRI